MVGGGFLQQLFSTTVILTLVLPSTAAKILIEMLSYELHEILCLEGGHLGAENIPCQGCVCMYLYGYRFKIETRTYQYTHMDIIRLCIYDINIPTKTNFMY